MTTSRDAKDQEWTGPGLVSTKGWVTSWKDFTIRNREMKDQDQINGALDSIQKSFADGDEGEGNVTEHIDIEATKKSVDARDLLGWIILKLKDGTSNDRAKLIT